MTTPNRLICNRAPARSTADVHVPWLALVLLCLLLQGATVGWQRLATPQHIQPVLVAHEHGGELFVRHAHDPVDGGMIELDDDDHRNGSARGAGEGGVVRTTFAENADRRDESPVSRDLVRFRSRVISPLERPPRA